MTGKRVLIIEDDPDLLDALVTRFQKSNFQVEWARDGVSGLGQALHYKPDVILLDILLPQREGLQMLVSLRQYEWAKQVPVIVLTNFDDSRFVSQAASLQVADYLVKSNHQLEEVVERVNAVLALQPTQ